MTENLIYLLFSVTFGLYYISLIEKWPRIGRLSLIISNNTDPKIKKIVKESRIIVFTSHASIFVFLAILIKVMEFYLPILRNGNLNEFLLVISLMSFLFLSKFLSGFIRGLIIILIPELFHERIKKSYEDNRTQEEVYLTKEIIDTFGLLELKNIRPYGRKKLVGNLLFLEALFLIPFFGSYWFFQVIPLIIIIVGLLIEVIYAHNLRKTLFLEKQI